MHLHHAFDLSDEEVIWQWVENPYWQVLTGEAHLRTKRRLTCRALTRLRKRLGDAGVAELLAETIELAKRAGVIKASSVRPVIVDPTVMEKAIARSTDSRSLERCREHLMTAATRHALKLRQNYNGEAPKLESLCAREAVQADGKASRTLRSRVSAG